MLYTPQAIAMSFVKKEFVILIPKLQVEIDKSFNNLAQFGKTRTDKFPGKELYRYYKGPYNTKAAAEQALQGIRKAGRAKAFLVPLGERPDIIKDLEDIYK